MASKGQLVKSQLTVIEDCIKVHGDTYDYSCINYTTAEVPITIICRNHGVFTRRPYDHIQRKRGCPKCIKQFHIDYSKPGVLYYIAITKNNRTFYKLGVTSKSIEERFYKWELQMVQVLSVQAFSTVKKAIDREQELLLKYAKWKYKGTHIINTGNTELFSIDILNLTKEKL